MRRERPHVHCRRHGRSVYGKCSHWRGLQLHATRRAFYGTYRRGGLHGEPFDPPLYPFFLPHCLQYDAPLLLITYHPPPSPSPPPNTHRDRKWGWSRLEASATELTWQHLRWLTGEVGDEVTITKKAE